MTARIALVLVATIAMLAVLVTRVMAVSVLAGTVLASVLAGLAVLYVGYRLVATGPGQHAAPRGFAAEDERLAGPSERVIPRAVTEHEPPWEPAHAPDVIEPAAVISGPPEPEPEAYWIAAGTVSDDGRVRTVRVAMLPPPVEALLGHSTTAAAVESMSAQWRSVESIFNGHHAREVRALTDGAS
jgi:hypothetical protein